MKEAGRKDPTMEVIERISVLEGKVSEHDRIFDMIREEIRGLREYIDGRIDSNFKWMLGVQITMWITIIVAILLH
ncbi:hypothetical protein DRN97_05165 [Methanosarcinales archaeon]|nr:MAG: hypothetical protein DRN97_05165 [Methanosarcinales archaeon]